MNEFHHIPTTSITPSSHDMATINNNNNKKTTIIDIDKKRIFLLQNSLSLFKTREKQEKRLNKVVLFFVLWIHPKKSESIWKCNVYHHYITHLCLLSIFFRLFSYLSSDDGRWKNRFFFLWNNLTCHRHHHHCLLWHFQTKNETKKAKRNETKRKNYNSFRIIKMFMCFMCITRVFIYKYYDVTTYMLRQQNR